MNWPCEFAGVWIAVPTRTKKHPIKIHHRLPSPSARRPQNGNAAICPRLYMMKMRPVLDPAPESPNVLWYSVSSVSSCQSHYPDNIPFMALIEPIRELSNPFIVEMRYPILTIIHSLIIPGETRDGLLASVTATSSAAAGLTSTLRTCFSSTSSIEDFR